MNAIRYVAEPKNVKGEMNIPFRLYLTSIEKFSNILSKIDRMSSASNEITAQQHADVENRFLACQKLVADLDAFFDRYRLLAEKKSKESWRRSWQRREDMEGLRSRVELVHDNLNATILTAMW